MSIIFYKSDTLNIYLNTNSCTACNLLAKQIEKYSNYYKKLYLIKADSAIKNELFDSYNFSKNTFNEIKYLSNNYFIENKQKGGRSFYIVKNQLKNDTFILGDFTKLILPSSEIQATVKKLKVSDKVTFSNSSTFYIANQIILIIDEKLNKALITQISGDSLILKEVLTKNSFKNKDFFKFNLINEGFYNEVKNDLEIANVPFYRFVGGYIKGSLINILINFSEPKLAPNKVDVDLSSRIFIFSIDIINNKRSLSIVNADGLNNTDSILGNKFFISSFNLIKNVDTIYLSITTRDTLKKSLFVKQMVKNGIARNVAITKDLSNLIPQNYKFTEFKNGFDFVSRNVTETNYYFLKAPIVYDINSKKTYYINNTELINLLNGKNDYISDVKVEGDKIKFIIFSNKTWFLNTYNTNNNKSISTEVLNVPTEISWVLFKSINSILLHSYEKNELFLLDIN